MYAGTMTIDQALEAMKAGHKVANSYFTSDEYLACEVYKGLDVDPDTGSMYPVEVVFIYDKSGCAFNSWFFGEDGLGGEPSFKNTGLCWLIKE